MTVVRSVPTVVVKDDGMMSLGLETPTQVLCDKRVAIAAETQRFDLAQAAEAKRDYDDATWLARESAADSELAITKSRLGKSREAVARLKQDNGTLDRELSEHAPAEAQP